MDIESATTQQSTESPAQPRVITLDEVKLHHKDEDCWLIIRGKVYDVS